MSGRISRSSMVLWWVSMTLAGAGCVGAPEVRPVYQDNRTSVRLQTDIEAGKGHSHPTTVSPVEMARILAGVRVVEQRYAVQELLASQTPVLAAFNSDEIRVLAPALSEALGTAKPGELVTFYRQYSSDAVGLAYTTGGLFLHGDRLYFVLANYRQAPSDVMRRGIPAYERDPIDDPLLSLLRGRYAVLFIPEEAEVHPAKGDWTWSYPDPGKVVIVDRVLGTRRAWDPGAESHMSTNR